MPKSEINKTKPALRLYADVGGTNARFALGETPGELLHVRSLACADYATLEAAIHAYLREVESAGAVDTSRLRHAGVAIATQVDDDMVSMTNHCWQFSRTALQSAFNLDTLGVCNDFMALAMSLQQLSPSDKEAIGDDKLQPRVGEPIALLGAGTGLGVSSLIPAPQGGYFPLNTEGGHVLFAPANELEVAILRHGWQEFPHLSAERLLSGPGLERIYRALCALRGSSSETPPDRSLAVAQIVERARLQSCDLCVESTQLFSAMLGSFAANLALTLGSRGGVYVGGGVVPNMREAFDKRRFRQRFEDKGRFGTYLSGIPVWLIVAPCPALLGIAHILEASLNNEA